MWKIIKDFNLGLLAAVIFTMPAKAQNKLIVPAGGNSWVKTANENDTEKVDDNGWQNWQHKDAVWSTYIRFDHPGTLQLSALLSVPEGKSELSFSI